MAKKATKKSQQLAQENLGTDPFTGLPFRSKFKLSEFKSESGKELTDFPFGMCVNNCSYLPWGPELNDDGTEIMVYEREGFPCSDAPMRIEVTK